MSKDNAMMWTGCGRSVELSPRPFLPRGMESEN